MFQQLSSDDEPTRRRPELHPQTADADYLPIHLSDTVREAIDTVGEGTKGNRFEPLAFDHPDGWTRTKCVIGGNSDIDGHHEITRWEHPFYTDITVESPKGDDEYHARGDDNSPFHIGSRHVSYVRATQHIADCSDAPGIPIQAHEIQRIVKLKDRCMRLSSRVEEATTSIDYLAESYPKQSILDAVTRALKRNKQYRLLRELKPYIEAETREWDATITA
jgi:hypothetical protein